MKDLNKTELTHAVTTAAVAYLSTRGCEPLELEVAVRNDWIADAAGVLSPTRTQLIDLRLLPRCPRGADALAYSQWSAAACSLFRLFTCLVEVKTSRGDFRGDKKWTCAEPPADLMYLAVPKGMIKPKEWPDGWGILEYQEARQCVRLVRVPTVRQTTTEMQLRFVLRVATKCDHRVRYAEYRDWQKAERRQETVRCNRVRLKDALRFAQDVLDGTLTLDEECKEFHRRLDWRWLDRRDINEKTREEMREFYQKHSPNAAVQP